MKDYPGQKLFEVQDAPPCPECEAEVTHVLLKPRDRYGLRTDIFLQPCAHQVAKATYHWCSNPDCDIPYGWSWT